jgi:arabinosaccharide transport system substrate-binding protein
MVELLDGTMGIFTKGPLSDVGFVDLTDRIHDSGLYSKLVQARFGRWSSRGRIFALPHDVHPVMLAYRRDLVEQLGIDVSKLTTWDEFVRVGREVTRDYTGDGVIDHYMIDLPANAAWALRLLILQRGGGLFDKSGNVIFDSDAAADVICWYVRQTQGTHRIAFGCDWGQTLSKAMHDGLCLFYIAPDWRTAQFEMDCPGLRGKLSLMPLPAWEPGGLRTSTWGATGLAITRNCRNPELAWKLAMFLYYQPEELARRFADTNILPPYIPSWSLPQFDEPREFFSGVRLGRVYADLGALVPDEPSSPYMQQAEGKLWEACTRVAQYYVERGDEGLREFAAQELRSRADDVRRLIARNVFLDRGRDQQGASR